MNSTVTISRYLMVCLASQLFGAGSWLSAQEQSRTEGDTLKAKVLNVQDYTPTISDARKLVESPVVLDSNIAKPSPIYQFEPKPLATSYAPDTIAPASMKGEALDPLYRGHALLGIGNGINYMADAYVNTLRSRSTSVGIDLHGVSSQGARAVGNEAFIQPSPYSRWNGSVDASHFLKKHAINGRLGYDREAVRYYGFSDTNAFYQALPAEAFSQVYNELFAEAAVKSFHTDSGALNYNSSLRADRFSAQSGGQEWNVLFVSSVNKMIGNHLFEIEAGADLNSVSYPNPFYHNAVLQDAQGQNTIVSIKPTGSSYLMDNDLQLEYGLLFQAEVGSSGTTPRLYPHLYAKYNLVNAVLIPYGGLGGGLMRNNLNNLSEQNPFLWTSLTALRNTDRVYSVYAGLRGSISSKITYNVCASQYQDRSSPLFVNYNASSYNPGQSLFGENYFVVVYDTIQTQELSGEVTFREGERIQVIGSVAYRNFSTTAQSAAWHRPKVESSISGHYKIKPKLTLRLQAHMLGAQPTKGLEYGNLQGADIVDTELLNGEIYSVVQGSLKPIFDLSAGIEYRYTERLSAFANVNNMLAQRYQRWNNYPLQRINVLAGLSYSFWRE